MQPPRAAWTPPTTLPPGRREIQTLEHQRQLRGRHRSALRQVEPAAFQALVPDPKPGLVPQQQLHPVPPPIAEHEQLTRQRIGAQSLAHQRLQPVERPPHVHRLAVDRHPQPGRQHQHPDVSKTDSRRARAVGSKPCGTRRVRPSGQRSSKATPSSSAGRSTARSSAANCPRRPRSRLRLAHQTLIRAQPPAPPREGRNP